MRPVSQDATNANATPAVLREFLTFRLGDEDYAIDILTVQEIRMFESVTKLPSTPEYVKGVINLRGVIAPVIDLRVKFNFEKAEYGPFTVLVVLRVHGRFLSRDAKGELKINLVGAKGPGTGGLGFFSHVDTVPVTRVAIEFDTLPAA